MTKQIETYGSNFPQQSFYANTSRNSYQCSNTALTRGITSFPGTLDECFNQFASVKQIAQNIGFIKGVCAGACGDSYIYDLYTGSSVPDKTVDEDDKPIDIYFDDPSGECLKVYDELGPDWLGCLWGTPNVPFSCVCPAVRANYHNYLKLRLNVCTFWNTPKETPVRRAAFLDTIKYSTKVIVTIAGDFNLRIGQVMELNMNAASGYPYASAASITNGLYYIIGIKHVVTNSGTHETALTLTQMF